MLLTSVETHPGVVLCWRFLSSHEIKVILDLRNYIKFDYKLSDQISELGVGVSLSWQSQEKTEAYFVQIFFCQEISGKEMLEQNE